MDNIKMGGKVIQIKKEWKTGFLATWIIGMLAHAYRFFNFLPTWDSMYNFTGTGATFWSGRCYLGYASSLSSKYDMSWINGSLSLLYISIAVVLLIDIFRITERWAAIMLAGLIVSFPTITSTFAYMFTADGYMLSFLLSVLGVYLTWKYKYGLWLGMICIGLSIGTYQAYISVTIVVVLLIVIQHLFIDSMSFKDVFFKDWKYLVTVIGGAVFYKITDSLFNLYYGITLTGYQGIDSVGIMSLEEYRQAFHKTFSDLAHLWCLHNGILSTNKYGYANVAVVCGIAIATIALIIKNRVYNNILGLLLGVICILLLPIMAFSVNFVSPGTDYHTLMEMGVCFIYILLLLFIAKGKWKHKLFKGIAATTLVFLCYYNTINANIAYTQMNLSYEKSYGVAGNLLDRIEQLDEYPGISKVAIFGRYEASSAGIDELTPAIMGVSQKSFLNGEYHYISMWNYVFGRGFAMSSGDEKNAIRETEAYMNMPVYPAKESIKVINDTIVIKLSE